MAGVCCLNERLRKYGKVFVEADTGPSSPDGKEHPVLPASIMFLRELAEDR
jgi:hypothetical protein